MRATTFITSSLLAIAISGAPVKRQELVKLSVGQPDLELPSVPKVPTGLLSLPSGLPSALPTAIPTELLSLPTGMPSAFPTAIPTGLLSLPTGLPHLPATPKPPTGDLKLPIKRADLPAVDGLTNGVKAPALPTDDVKLPKLPEAGNVLKDVTSIGGVDPKVNLPLSVSTGLRNRQSVNTAIDAPVNMDVDVDDLAKQVKVDDLTKKVSVPAVDVPTVGVPKVDVPKVDVPKVDVPKVDVPKVDVPKVDVPKVDVPTMDASTVNGVPKVALQSRQVVQDIPVVGDVDTPGLPKVQVGTLDKYVGDVVKGTTGI